MLARLVNELRRSGLGAGDVVAAVGGNAPELWTLLRATEELGLVLAPMNVSSTHADLKRSLDRLGAQLIIGYGHQSPNNPHLPTIDRWLAHDGELIERLLIQPRSPRARTSPELAASVEAAAILTTSGSTGEPKSVVSSYRNRAFLIAAIGKYLGLSARQRIVSALPPSFGYGFYQGLLSAGFGCALDLIPSMQMVGELIRRLQQERRIVLPLTPTMATRLIKEVDAAAFPNVETVTLAGGVATPGLRRKLAAAFPFARIFAMYGLTECQRISYLNPDEFLRRQNSCGRVLPGVAAKIVDENNKVVPAGHKGELVVSGDNVCLGYWGDPTATRQRFRTSDGKTELHTGDIFRSDDAGYLEFVGRNDELIKLRDERVSLALAKSELRRSELILDLELKVQSDPDGVSFLVAFVVLDDPETTRAKVLDSFRQLVSRPGHFPSEIVVVPSPSMTPNGKWKTVP
jgi:acyl-CoA synthetase (AMP-forming)/AMP-acid ligase II